MRLSFNKRRWRTLFLYRPSLQWPMYGVDPARTQVQASIRIRPPFRIAWSRGLGSLIEFPAVVSEGVAFIGNARGHIRAVSMKTGKVAWRTDTGDKMAASPAVVGDEIIVHTMSTGRVLVLNRYNGKILRRFTIGSPIESSPVVKNGIDYFGAWSGVVYAFDLRRGRAKWTYTSGYKITSSAALYGGKVFIGDYGGRLLALNARNGKPELVGLGERPHLWNARRRGPPRVRSLLVGRLADRVLGHRAAGCGHARPAPTSTPLRPRGEAASTSGRTTACSTALSGSSGATLWTANAGGRISGAAVVVDGIVYAGTTRRIIGADARTGRIRFNFAHGEYVPVSGNGQRLLFHGFSRIYALEQKHRRA